MKKDDSTISWNIATNSAALVVRAHLCCIPANVWRVTTRPLYRSTKYGKTCETEHSLMSTKRMRHDGRQAT